MDGRVGTDTQTSVVGGGGCVVDVVGGARVVGGLDGSVVGVFLGATVVVVAEEVVVVVVAGGVNWNSRN